MTGVYCLVCECPKPPVGLCVPFRIECVLHIFIARLLSGNWDLLVDVKVFPGMPLLSLQGLSEIGRGSQGQRVFVSLA